jgi:hypothetical protein
MVIYVYIWPAIYNIDMEAASVKPGIKRVIPPKESVYLDGPRTRTYELSFAWEVFTRFIKSFRTLHFVGPCITVFGSARYKEDHPYYEKPGNLASTLLKQVSLL